MIDSIRRMVGRRHRHPVEALRDSQRLELRARTALVEAGRLLEGNLERIRELRKYLSKEAGRVPETPPEKT